jgi:hypothetical protein
MKKTLLLTIALIIYSYSYAAVMPIPIIMDSGNGIFGNVLIALWIAVNLFLLIGMTVYYFFFRDKRDGFFTCHFMGINVGTIGLLTINSLALISVLTLYIASLL